jgi:hypothetical protein
MGTKLSTHKIHPITNINPKPTLPIQIESKKPEVLDKFNQNTYEKESDEKILNNINLDKK